MENVSKVFRIISYITSFAFFYVFITMFFFPLLLWPLLKPFGIEEVGLGLYVLPVIALVSSLISFLFRVSRKGEPGVHPSTRAVLVAMVAMLCVIVFAWFYSQWT